MTTKLTAKQSQLLQAIKDGAELRYAGYQEIKVTYPLVAFGVQDPRNYTARQQTLYALRDRGLIELGSFGVRLTSA